MPAAINLIILRGHLWSAEYKLGTTNLKGFDRQDSGMPVMVGEGLIQIFTADLSVFVP